MKNIISSFKSTFKTVSNIVKDGIDSIRSVTKTKVGAVLAAGAIGLSSNVYASETWVMVEKAGMGPGEFSQKYFKTSNWKLLRDRDGNFIRNPRTDFILGREYTIFSSDRKDIGTEKVIKTEQKQSELVDIKTVEKEIPKIEKTVDVIAKSEELPKVASKKEVEVKKDAKKEEELLKAREKDIRVKKVGDKPYYVIPEESYPEEIRNFLAKYDFDYEAFVNSIIQKESRGNPMAFNGGTRAMGLIQFLPSTLISEGYNKGGRLTSEMIHRFRKDISLQFKYIHRYNAKTFDIILKNPELVDRELKKGKSLGEALTEFGAEAVFAGHASIGRGWKGNDGSTSIPSYKREVVSNYREFIAANDDKFDTNTVASSKREKTISAIVEKKVGDLANIDLGIEDTGRFEKVSMVDTNIPLTNASNDRFYSNGIVEIPTAPVISDTVMATEKRIKDIISNIDDAPMRESIEVKISESKTTSIKYFYSNLEHYKKISANLGILSKSAIGMEYDRIIQEKKKADNIVSKLIKVISYAEARELKKAA